jgi:hypothetical protein
MMTNHGYAAARLAAPRIWTHFSQHLDAARERGRVVEALLPDPRDIEVVIDAAFWASLRREEGYVPKISLAVLPPERTENPLRFERPLPLTPPSLAKVAPAVERAGIHLGVWHEGGELCVWGTLRAIPTFAFVLEVAAPGLLVVKHHRGDEWGKFVNVAVLEGDSVKVVDARASNLPDCPPLLASLLGFDSPGSWTGADGSVNVLVQLAVSMRAHGRGGLLLVVPRGSDAWRESIVQPVLYRLNPPFAELADLMRQESQDVRQHQHWQEALAKVIDTIGGVTAVDGATVMTDDFELLAFGAKIARRRGAPPVERLTVTEPIEGGTADVVHPMALGGTRHLSAAQFVQDQRDTTAFVASQDGRFTVFAWSPCEEMVHAHRVETLLL